MAHELNFADWMVEVTTEAKRRVGRDDVEWLIGGESDMREGFDDDMSPNEYVQSQVEHID